MGSAMIVGFCEHGHERLGFIKARSIFK